MTALAACGVGPCRCSGPGYWLRCHHWNRLHILAHSDHLWAGAFIWSLCLWIFLRSIRGISINLCWWFCFFV